jgi:hypothetical protein
MPLKKKFHVILESKKSNHQFLLGELAIKYKEIIACENKHFYLFVILLSQVVLGQK